MVTFSLTGEDGTESIEGVDVFKHLGRLLDWSEDNWPEVLKNIRKAQQVSDLKGIFCVGRVKICSSWKSSTERW